MEKGNLSIDKLLEHCKKKEKNIVEFEDLKKLKTTAATLRNAL